MRRVWIFFLISALFLLGIVLSGLFTRETALYENLPDETVAVFITKAPVSAGALTKAAAQISSTDDSALYEFFLTGSGERALLLAENPWRIALIARSGNGKERTELAAWAEKYGFMRAPMSGARIVFAESWDLIQSVKEADKTNGRRIFPSSKSLLSSLEEALIVFPNSEFGLAGSIISKDNVFLTAFPGAADAQEIMKPDEDSLVFWQGAPQTALTALSGIAEFSLPHLRDGLNNLPNEFLEGNMAIHIESDFMELAWQIPAQTALSLVHAALSELSAGLASFFAPKRTARVLPDKTLIQELRSFEIEPADLTSNESSVVRIRHELMGLSLAPAKRGGLFHSCRLGDGIIIGMLNLESAPIFLAFLRDNALYLCVDNGG